MICVFLLAIISASYAAPQTLPCPLQPTVVCTDGDAIECNTPSATVDGLTCTSFKCVPKFLGCLDDSLMTQCDKPSPFAPGSNTLCKTPYCVPKGEAC